MPSKRAGFVLWLLFSLSAIWAVALYDLERSRASALREVEQGAIFQAQAFAENSRSTIKRLNELTLDLRAHWSSNRAGFADMIRLRQEHTADLAFQVAVIDADGYLAYSNLANARERVYLGERDHFRIHEEGRGDRLFISKPVLGKVSGKWSIQFSRRIVERKRFAGVLVISVSPQAFVEFSQKNPLRANDVSAMVADGGHIMARQPSLDDHVGKQLANTPFLVVNAPLSGHYTRIAQTDGVERIYGFFRMPEYGLSFIVGRGVEAALASYHGHRQVVLAVSGLISVIIAFLFALQWRAQRARREMQQQVRDSQSMLRSAVDALGEAFVVYDKDDRLAYCNEQCRAYYQTSADLLVAGRPYEEILRIGAARGQYPAAAGRLEAWLAETLEAHRRGATALIQQTDAGRWLRVLDRVTPDGGRVGFRIDITELVEAKDAAESANRAKSDFLANMSHEIRTPLNGMLGMAQVLLTPELPEGERIDGARTILQSGQTLLALLNEILDLAKVEAGKFELQPTACAPLDLAWETVRLFSVPAHLKKQVVEVVSTLPPDRRYLADANRLRQMLSNLLGNAIKFTAQGAIRVEAHQIDDGADGALLEFAVTDCGIGIAESDFPLLFEPFSQKDSSATRQYGGSGLGLSIVRKLARLMGGDAGLTSEIGHGSRFWFRIRVQAVPHMAAAPGPGDAGDAGGAPPRLSGRVMVVDDDALHRKVFQVALEQQGLTCSLFENGQQAVDAVTSGERFDLILTDINMPLLDGYAVTEQIRGWQRQRGQPRCPIVAITANAYDEDRRRCLASGMDDFIEKPIQFSSLRKLTARWLPRAAVGAAPAPAVTHAGSLDWAAVLPLIDEIIPLLEQRKFDAFGRYKALKAAVANTELGLEIDALEKALNAMQFEQVILPLRQLAQARGEKLTA